MSQLTPLKRQITSIKTTKKLTHAMRLISMSLYSKLDKQKKALEYHNQQISSLFFDITQHADTWKNAIFFPDDILNARPLFIIISSIKGFCGSLNGNLFRYLERGLFIEEHQTPSFITIGSKATHYVEDQKLGPILESYHDLNSNNFADIARRIRNRIDNSDENITYSSVTFYSTHLKNFFSQAPKKNTVIPLSRPQESIKTPIKKDQESIEPIWEQSREDIANAVGANYLHNNIIYILFQALISEYAARFVSMDSATTNAESYLEKLTLQFNKLRQGLITKEVSELSVNL